MDSYFYQALDQDWDALDKKSVLLIQNMITEQMNNSFHKDTSHANISEEQMTHFKFFLNTLEILCHSLEIIRTENYSYRTKNYGKYEVFLIYVRQYFSKSSNIFQEALKREASLIIRHLEQLWRMKSQFL